jgi:hypothetical protein
MSARGCFLAGQRAGGEGGGGKGSKSDELEAAKMGATFAGGTIAGGFIQSKAVDEVELQGPTGESLSFCSKTI